MTTACTRDDAMLQLVHKIVDESSRNSKEEEKEMSNVSKANYQSKKILLWLVLSGVVGLLASQFLPAVEMTIALTGLAMAIMGTILFGEERLPFVLAGVGFVIVTDTIGFYEFIKGAEWVLFIKLVALLTWVEFLFTTGFFNDLVERVIPKGLKGTALFVVLLVIAFISAALIDEVNSIVIIYALTRSIIGFTSEKFKMSDSDWGKTVVTLVSGTNMGSQLLPLGNPVGIAIASIAGLSVIDFINFSWIPALISFLFYLAMVRIFYSPLLRSFGNVEVEAKDFDTLGALPAEEYTVFEVEEVAGHTHTVSHLKPGFRTLLGLFLIGVVGLVIATPVGQAVGLGENGLGLFALLLWAITLHVASAHGEHSEELLKKLPWSTLIFIVLLFGVAHVLEHTGVTELVAEEVYHLVGDNLLLMVMVVAVIGALVTAVMDNVIAVAVIAGVITQLETLGLPVTVLWFVLLANCVVAANATPIGSAANIIANSRVKLTWGQWWKYGGWIAIPTSIVNTFTIYVWIVIVLGQ